MKNPKWHRDEIILALDLYFSPERGPIDRKNPKVIALSKTLNELPLLTDRPDKEKFRNPNGVSLKLSNFLSIDPEYGGKGMTKRSEMDKKVFDEFLNQKQRLSIIANEIRKILDDSVLYQAILAIEEDEQTTTDAVEEGQILYKLHKVRERNLSIVKRKKEEALKLHGRLACEICEFNFASFYGPIGKNFIECHHRTPLANLKTSTKTSLEDLALVCSNCHKMLHKNINSLSTEKLRAMIIHN